jgi:hypothetical protein
LNPAEVAIFTFLRVWAKIAIQASTSARWLSVFCLGDDTRM